MRACSSYGMRIRIQTYISCEGNKKYLDDVIYDKLPVLIDNTAAVVVLPMVLDLVLSKGGMFL